ncbi:MAG: tetratricopeptide repeat-containing protein [Pyrinomonadaceae bacterium]
MSKENAAEKKGTCFVVMGFGKKMDFETKRTLDLDKTYNQIIKPAVEDAGLECIRANEIVHSGVIDVWMYEQLLKADVVVADLSTSNKNAYYELGVRHALRPYTTIIICEDGAQTFPFDVNHVAIRQYHHLGEGIDFDEVMRFRKLLTDAIVKIYNDDPRPKDSPVYTFLQDLAPPELAKAIQDVAEAVAATAPSTDGQEDIVNYSERMQEVNEAQEAGDFGAAKFLLTQLRKKMREAARKSARKAAEDAAKQGAQEVEVKERPEDPYVIQQLALVTYKSKQPTPQAALEEARELLKTLDPATSNDPETLGLWGAVHKRLWEIAGESGHLDEAVRGYERGFYVRNDYYNGINFAYLLNVRAANAAKLARAAADPPAAALHWASAIADFVQAERIRAEVLEVCERWLAENSMPGEHVGKETKAAHLETRYWVIATKAEALLGTGQAAQAEQIYKEAYALNPPKAFMIPSTEEQREKLQNMLTESPLRHVSAATA